MGIPFQDLLNKSVNGYHDLNNSLYRSVSDKHKQLWNEEEYLFWTSAESVKSLIQEYNDEIDKWIDRIISRNSPLVGFSLYSSTLHFTLEVIKRLKIISPDTLVVLGGPSATVNSRERDLINNPNVDALVTREADETLPEMMKLLHEKGHLEKIPGLIFKYEGNIINGGERDLVQSLDTLPFPDYSDFDFSQYDEPGRLDIFSSRSCINKCHFCSERNYFIRFRSRSGRSLFREVQYHLSHTSDIRMFYFSDSVMNGSMETLREFSELLIRNNVRITWGGQGIIRREMTSEVLKLMASAGCVIISYGIESGSEAVRKSMNKDRFTNEVASRVIKDTHDAGIKTGANFMFGYPTETEEDFQMTLDFVRQHHKWLYLVLPSYWLTAILPDTYLHNNPEEFGIAPSSRHPFFWETEDRSITFPVRLDRFERFCNLCRELDISTVIKIPEERTDKWKLLGAYHLFKKNYAHARDCFKRDLTKHGHSHDSAKFFLESCKNAGKIEK